jgi:hypothetical protein
MPDTLGGWIVLVGKGGNSVASKRAENEKRKKRFVGVGLFCGCVGDAVR